MENRIDFERMRELINKIPSCQFKIERQRSQAEKMTTVITGMPHGSGGDRSPVEDGAIKLMQLEEAYKEVLDELRSFGEILNPLIDKLDDANERAMMRLRYIYWYSIPDIAETTAYSERRVQQILRESEENISLNFTV